MTSSFILEKLVVGAFACNCYLVGSKVSNEAFIIDPGAESSIIIDKIKELKVNPVAIILTHGHPDHTGALSRIKRAFDIPLWFHEGEFNTSTRKKADVWLSEGDGLTLHDLNGYWTEYFIRGRNTTTATITPINFG